MEDIMKCISVPILILVACFSTVQAQDPSTSPLAKNPRARRVLIVGGIDNTMDAGGIHHGLFSAEIYNEKTQAFVATGSMNEGRVGQQATLLADGKVLVTGGDGAETNHPVASAELYDPNTGVFSPTGNMTIARVGHTAVLLSNRLVLLAGGQDSMFTTMNTAELFDPATGIFTATGSMNEARVGHTATLLDNGKVLIAGGNLLSLSAELYDPATGAFSLTSNMSIARQFATATLLDDGKVLIAGGGTVVGNCYGCSVNSAEIYDPKLGEFIPVGNMGSARRGHISVLLKNHNVLVAGGIDDDLPDPQRFLSSAEIFDGRNFIFSSTSSTTVQRFDHAATLLGNGDVLITGGFTGGLPITDTGELFDPKTGSFATTGNMTDARAEHTSSGLPKHSGRGQGR
jgi:galactose oxidase-like protein/Kelch motif protein